MVSRIAQTVALAMIQVIADAVDADAGAGKIELRTGSQPATPQTAASGTLLATFNFGDPAFEAAAVETNYASITAEAIASATAVAAGNAGWFRILDNSGDAVYDGSVTVTGGGGEMTIGNVAISNGSEVNVTSLKISLPKGY